MNLLLKRKYFESRADKTNHSSEKKNEFFSK